MRRPKFTVYQARDGWRWRLTAANGRIIATGEAHTRKADAERAVRTVRNTVSRLGAVVWIKRGTPMADPA